MIDAETLAAACAAILARGEQPSANKIVAYCHARELSCGKRTALAFLAAHPELRGLSAAAREEPAPLPVEYPDVPEVLQPVDVADDAVVAAPETPAAPDPVALAESRLRQCEQILADAREALTHSKTVLLTTRPLRLDDGRLVGSLHPHDEYHQHALWDVEDAKRHYDQAWAEREDARQRLEQAEKVHRRAHQEAWVQTHRPELCANLEHWAEQIRTAPSDRMHAEAKKNYQQVRMSYEREVLTAPWNANGTH